ncbi:MAG: hypothetical protein E7267_01185 [Lachnospiraceae bacterium]|nr:hypothetical protein [Lachnospiraceae bacterium]
MEDKLRQILDNLNEQETDELLKKQYEWESGLNEERIWEMVFDKTGVSSKARTRRRIMYGFAGMVACLAVFFTAFFTLSHGNGSGVGKQPADNLVDRGDEMFNFTEAPTYVVDNDDDKNDDKDNDKDDSHSKKPSKNHSGDNPDRIASGKNSDLVGLSTKEIAELLDEYACEIDMASFVAEYNNVDDMLMDCDIVVRGAKKQSILSITGDDDIYSLMAGFEVSSVLWNNTDEEIDDEIMVKEGITVNAENKCYTHVKGYIPMQLDKEYILFLKFTGKSYCKVAGGVYGKIPLDSSEEILHLDSDYVINQDIKDLYSIVSYARDRFENYTPPTATPDPADINEDEEDADIPSDSEIDEEQDLE